MITARDDRRRTFDALPAGAQAATWWGKAWVAALEALSRDQGRLARGRSYAEEGRVEAVTVTPGRLVAYVRGSRSRPYRTEIALDVFAAEDWEVFLERTAADPGYLAALLEGEVPQGLAEALLPGPGELHPRCSCPDPGRPPCKHAAALCHRVAHLLDADPFVLLLLRGRGERELTEELTRRNAAHAAREQTAGAPGLPGVPARTAVAPRSLPPLPPPLPDPPGPGHPPSYPDGPGAPDPLALDQLATDAAARAYAILATGRDPMAGLTLWQDAVRLAAAHPTQGLTGAARALYRDLARAAGRPVHDLARAATAWRHGGLAGLEVLEEPWDPPAGPFDRARPALLAAGEGQFRPERNTLTLGGRQLRLGRDGLWYPYTGTPGASPGPDWWPAGPSAPDPVAALHRP
ncbi:SWIM zinc finger family protein [Streptomyces bambusae]|uniref:SWIM zinc finger family protein n=1 Tax=Streptomyces bambusae TaxID=1550616 RepID=UPI001CFE38BA|nr:SWIM zinc finger family protein [Streptomyces bambusae]MCB5166784.1 SWIM zinc finger family protein [Streptomyces bambusae]